MNAGTQSGQRGITLIELMFAITILAILMGIATPSFLQLIRNNRVTTLTNDFVSSVMIARSEAMKRGIRVSLCPTSDGAVCSGSTDWSAGWLIFSDDTGTQGALDAPADEIIQVLRGPGNTAFAPTGYTLTGGVSYLQFEPTGLTRASAATTAASGSDPAGWRFDVKQTGCTGNLARRIVVTSLGRPASRTNIC